MSITSLFVATLLLFIHPLIDVWCESFSLWMSYANPVKRVKKRSPNVKGGRMFIRFQLFPKIAISKSIKQAARGYERPWPQLASKRDESPERCALHHISGFIYPSRDKIGYNGKGGRCEAPPTKSCMNEKRIMTSCRSSSRQMQPPHIITMSLMVIGRTPVTKN